MGFALAVFATLIVLFLVFAMAMAEWADRDPGELLFFWRKPKTGASSPEPETASAVSSKITKKKTTKGKIPGASAAGKNTAARKPAASKRKTR